MLRTHGLPIERPMGHSWATLGDPRTTHRLSLEAHELPKGDPRATHGLLMDCPNGPWATDGLLMGYGGATEGLLRGDPWVPHGPPLQT